MRTTRRPKMQLHPLSVAVLLVLPHCSYEFTVIRPLQQASCQNSPLTSGTLPYHVRFSRNRDRCSSDCLFSKSPREDEASPPTPSVSSLVTTDLARSISFSAIMAFCGAALGPFLDSYHSAFGVLQYDEPITAALWGPSDNPALITAWWVPVLFGVAGWLIGWLYILLDAVLGTPTDIRSPTPPKTLVGISLFTFQYWLSGVFVASGILDRTGMLNAMSLYAVVGFGVLDGSMAGFVTSAATALGGPLIEVGLLSLSRADMMPGGYHYKDLGETGFFPLWIAPVYFLGGPAVGNLARGFWNALSSKEESTSDLSEDKRSLDLPRCEVCNDTRCVPCPNCDGVGRYNAMGGRTVECTSCSGRGFVVCRACFSEYDEDPNDIGAIRELMSRMPD